MGDSGVVPEVLGDLNAALTNALAGDVEQMPPGEAEASARLLTRMRARFDALDARVVQAVDESGVWALRRYPSCQSFLRSMSNAHPGEANRRVRLSRRLRQMPLVREAYEDADITTDHVRVLAELLDRRYGDQFTAFEPSLVEYARTLSWPDFKQIIAAWKQAADETLADETDQADSDARELHISRSFNDRGIVNATLTPSAREAINRELMRIYMRLLRHDRAQAKTRLGVDKVTNDDLARTPAQRRHDAWLIMARRSAAHDGHGLGPSPEAFIHVSWDSYVQLMETAAGIDPNPAEFDKAMCEFEDGTRIPTREAIALLLRAKIHRVVYGPEGEILNLGSAARWFTPAQKRAIAARDRYCQCGCGLPARLCDADHITEFEDLGLTDITNGQPLCRTAHTLKTTTNQRRRHHKQAHPLLE